MNAGEASNAYGLGCLESRRFDVNKRDLVAEVSAKTRQPAPVVAEVVDALMRTITASVSRGEPVVLSGFGTFHRKARAKRVARNIWADEPVRVPATSVPAFRPGKPFREAVARRRGRGAARAARPARTSPPRKR